MNQTYLKTAKLMTQVLALIAEEESFALKGGTALNLFVQDLPRLSVDIDLTNLPMENRDTSLKNISEALLRLSERIQKVFSPQQITPSILKEGGRKNIFKLQMFKDGLLVKIEPNLVFRGTVFTIEMLKLRPKAEKLLESSVLMKVLSNADLYAGKICAALSRQHPRDLFDLSILQKTGGLTNEIKQAFIVYLASGNKPMHEMLSPNWKNHENLFEEEFSGMTVEDLTWEEIRDEGKLILAQIKKSLTKDEQDFLLSIKQGTPRWELMPFEHLKNLPSLQWKIMNVQKMKPSSQKEARKKLEKALKI